MTLTLKTKQVLREALKQRLDEELEQMNEDEATDEIMQSATDLGRLLDDNTR